MKNDSNAMPQEHFWAAAASDLHWSKPWDQVLDRDARPIPRWFAGGRINAAWNCVDRHVEQGHGAQPAIIYESPLTATSRMLTYAELRDAIARFAGLLRANGVALGDRVIIYMPNSPEAVIAMLACARIGAIHSVVFGGFAAAELAIRIDDARPKLIVAASCGIEPGRVIPYQPNIDAALAAATHRIDAVIYWQREQHMADIRPGASNGHRTVDWADAITAAQPVDCVDVDATHPLYILYTSGTTGAPKGIVRDTGGYLTALAWTMQAVYAIDPGTTYWAASDVGWVVGHSYIAYGPLLNRNTTLIYEGKPFGTPDAGAFWRLIEKHKVRVFFTAPTAIRAIKQVDPAGHFIAESNLTNLQAIFLAGERTDPGTLEWLGERIPVPVVDHWWQTETGWPICAVAQGMAPLPIKAGSTGPALPGWNVRCVDPGGLPTAEGEAGTIVIELPLPPGAAPTLWNADDRYVSAYLDRFPGYYNTGDGGFIDEDGYVFVMSRTDDVINVAGHRLSSSALEEVIAAHPDVAECAVVGIPDAIKGQVPLAFVVLKANATTSTATLPDAFNKAIRSTIGPIAALRASHIVQRLPKTRSGKILRRTMREMANGDQPNVPATIEDPAVLDELAGLFRDAASTPT